jgi:hypothetical protein
VRSVSRYLVVSIWLVWTIGTWQSEVAGLRLSTNYQLLDFQGEPGLRGEPAASGAEDVYKEWLSSGLERSDNKNDGPLSQAVEV